MAYFGCRPISAEAEDTVYACRRCGAEVVRTSMRQSSGQTTEAA
jgi:DNA-directed RNA polymerase subunit RPC12/RpoP